jgi:hypothetical protein
MAHPLAGHRDATQRVLVFREPSVKEPTKQGAMEDASNHQNDTREASCGEPTKQGAVQDASSRQKDTPEASRPACLGSEGLKFYFQEDSVIMAHRSADVFHSWSSSRKSTRKSHAFIATTDFSN